MNLGFNCLKKTVSNLCSLRQILPNNCASKLSSDLWYLAAKDKIKKQTDLEFHKVECRKDVYKSEAHL